MQKIIQFNPRPTARVMTAKHEILRKAVARTKNDAIWAAEYYTKIAADYIQKSGEENYSKAMADLIGGTV